MSRTMNRCQPIEGTGFFRCTVDWSKEIGADVCRFFTCDVLMPSRCARLAMGRCLNARAQDKMIDLAYQATRDALLEILEGKNP